MLYLDAVQAGYGDVTVLREVSLVVPTSSVVALLGPNGAGKTTLLRVASGLLRPNSGRVVLDDKDLTGAPPHALARNGICHVPEGRGIFPSLSVRDNLLLQVQRGQQDAVERGIHAFPKLAQRMTQLAGTLSGGEQQMLALARAYISEPAILLLDEVSMGLAPKIVDEVFAFLESIAADGASLLLVEQYVSRALDLADYVYIMNRGRIVFCGEPAELGTEEVFARYLGAEANAGG